MSATADQELAELRRAYEEMRSERDNLASELQTRTAALVRRNTEYGERIEYQAATIDVLKAMSASPGDPQPVFDLIVQRARDLCDAYGATVYEFDGTLIHYRAATGVSDDATVRAQVAAVYPIPPTRDSGPGRAILDRRIIRIDDMESDPGLHPILRHQTAKSAVFLPLLRGDVALGALALGSRERGGFSDTQIQLLQTFAEQAVIAITSAETYRALHTRTTDLQESLEYQTATGDVLKVISRSTFDLQPVLDTLVETAARLCDADMAAIGRPVGDLWRMAANFGFPAEFEAHQRSREPYPLDPESPTVAAKALREKAPVHIYDVAAVPGYPEASIRLGKQRTSLGVPLLRGDEAIGHMVIARQRVEPFTDRQIELVSTFADQAVIAIENTRLLTEQREALEQQTATAEVLQVINSSPGNLAPVFDAILEKAHSLCHVAQGSLELYDGEHFRAVAVRGMPDTFADMLRQGTPAFDNPATRPLIEGHRFSHISDLAETNYSLTQHAVELAACRTLLCVPLRRDDALLGMIASARREVRPFSEKEITLLESFAAQAVIAMENARLLTEQREALDQQIATTEVLQIINASPGDLKPVFDAVLAKALQLCAASFGTLLTFDGERLERVALRGVPPAFAEWSRQNPLTKDAALISRGLETGKPVQATDVLTDPFLVNTPSVRDALVNFGGVRALLQVPLLKDGAVHGFIALFRREPGGFPEKQVTLLEGFAAQAVIAMENARLLTELRQRTDELAKRNNEYGERIEQQSATIDVLKAMSASSGDAQPVFQAIVERARVFCNADNANLALVDGDMLHLQATTIGSSATAMAAAERADYMARFPRPVDATSLFGRAVLTRTAVQTPDVRSDPQHFTSLNTGKATVRALVAVPLLRAGAPMGAIVLARNTPGEFSATQIELLQTFAEQAVIAMSSSETFKELQHRSADLTRSVAELQALEEVLRAVNSSLELETVLSTIISRAVQLSDADEGTIYEFDGAEQVFVPKSAYGMTGERLAALRDRRIRIGETPLGNSAAVRTPVHIPDLTQTLDIDGARGLVEDGIHALLAVPLLRDEKVLGGLVIRRREVGGFAPSVQTLLQTFAGQSVLAIENARLFQEARQARVEAEIALSDLRRAQDQLVQAEKMASLGQLTAGIAHEIKNPLNFVNNFAELSGDMLDELNEAVANNRRAEIAELTETLKGNLAKIIEHGKRADNIVRGMLEHSRGSSGERRKVELNALVDEAMNLAYHGARAQDQSFSVTLQREFCEGIAPITLAPQDVTRVLLNLFSNGFYAARERQRIEATVGFEPTLKVSTRDLDGAVEIRVRDNGIGIPAEIMDRLFQPFFTTKPPGEGTGLGLSMSYDIITQQHGGSISVDSEVGEYSEFTIRLPRAP